MLRVRPIYFTSAPEDCAARLAAIGLTSVESHGDWQVFDAGNGKVGLHRAEAGSAADGLLVLGFEVRDPEIFVRRTLQDGTRAELVESRHGSTARVTAPDGTTFLADPATDLSLSAAENPLAVVATWRTSDPAQANKVLADIGAKHVQDYPDGGALFRAKNGGFVATAAGAAHGAGLEIRHGGGTLTLGAISEP